MTPTERRNARDARWLADYASGTPARTLANRDGVNLKTVLAVLHGAGVEVRQGRPAKTIEVSGHVAPIQD